MPRWGNINERRNQLHEVIRLSGMNIIIDDTDHPLIIKVASIQAARMQVYFIDNDEYFRKREMMTNEAGEEYADNAERAIFYARGVLETLKKLRWSPDIIHCHGWMSAAVPLYVKTAYREEPPFVNSKVVFSAYDETPTLAPVPNFAECLAFRDATTEVIAQSGVDLTSPAAFSQLAVAFSDGLIRATENTQPELAAFAAERGVPAACLGEDNLSENYGAFYDKIFGGEAE